MNFISFITGIILGLFGVKMNKIMFLIRVILSGFTSFVFLKLNYPNLYLWGIRDYFLDENYIRLIKSDFLTLGILYTFFCHLFIYSFIYRGLKISINKKGKLFISDFVEYKQEINIRAGIIYYLKASRRISKFINYFFDNDGNINSSDTFASGNEILSFASLFICTLYHILIVISVILNSYVIFFISILLVTIFYKYSKGIYLVVYYINAINKIFNEEKMKRIDISITR